MTSANRPEKISDHRQSLPPGRSSGNKIVSLLLVGGVLILGIAAVVYFVRKPAPAPPPAPVLEPAYAAPKPLVIQPSQPIVDRAPDAGAAVLVAGEEPKKPKAPAQERLGTIDAAAVNSFVNARFEQVRTCYERRLKMNPLLAGDLDLNISIASTGKVTGISVTSDSVGDAQMLECVRRTIRGWTFPKPVGGRAVVAKNFKFKKKS
jgi:hypothetical protein